MIIVRPPTSRVTESGTVSPKCFRFVLCLTRRDSGILRGADLPEERAAGVKMTANATFGWPDARFRAACRRGRFTGCLLGAGRRPRTRWSSPSNATRRRRSAHACAPAAMRSMRRLQPATRWRSSIRVAEISAAAVSCSCARKPGRTLHRFSREGAGACEPRHVSRRARPRRPVRSRKGWLAVGVPGTVLGMETARREFGTMARAALMAPAIALARDGFTLADGDLIPFDGASVRRRVRIRTQPNVRAIFMHDGNLPAAGTVLVQPQLARTLEAISSGGADAFYRGRDRARRRGGQPRRRRNPHARRLRALSRRRVGAAALRVSRIRRRVGSAAEFGRRDALRNPQRRRAVSAERVGMAQRAERALCYRSRTARLRRPQCVLRRSRLRPRSGRAAAFAAIRRDVARADFAGPRDAVGRRQAGIGNASPTRAATRRTTRSSIAGETPSRSPTRSTIGSARASSPGDTGFFLNDEMDDFTAKPGVAEHVRPRARRTQRRRSR